MTVQEHLPVAGPATSAGPAARRSAGSMSRRSSVTDAWPAAAAWGAGLVSTALGAGAVVGADSAVATRGVGILLATLGLTSLVWGGAVLSRGRLVAPRLALTGALAGVISAFGLLAVDSTRTSVYAVATATALFMIVGGTCAPAVRRGADRPRDPGTLRGILGLLLAAAVVAVLVTPALGATQDARLLRDDGTVPVVTHDH